MLMKRRHIAFIIFLSLGFFILILFNTVFFAGNDEIPLDQASSINNTPGSLVDRSEIGGIAPALLIIPKINVHADVEKVGITAKGNMATPRNYTDVGWYKFGVIPGEMGSAVMAGHVNNGLSFPAVFAELDLLQAGDDVYVTDITGTRLHFKITSKAVYDFNENVPEVFTQKDGRYLKLITCTGAWQEDLRTHDKRLVVTAVLAE
jgi:sortase A